MLLDILPRYSGIPRIIHQTYFTKTSLPAELCSNIESIQSLNPTWEYRLYDDGDIETFILQTYGQTMLNIYHKINPLYGAARADFFRYLLIYAVGGVYLDIKSTITRPLDAVLRDNDFYILSQWDHVDYPLWGFHSELKHIPGGELQQWHIISAPRHPFLYHVIQQVIQNIHTYQTNSANTGFKGVIQTTGPIAYTRAIAPLLGVYPYRQVAIEQELGILYSIYDSMSEDKQSNHRHLSKHHYTELNTPLILETEQYTY